MPRADKLKRWNTSETVEILKYINDNFELWYENHINACIKAMKAANITRDAKSVYNKVHNMVKVMRDYDGTQKLPNDPIWENEKVFNLLKGICKKTKEKTDQKKTTTTNTNSQTNEMVDGNETMDENETLDENDTMDENETTDENEIKEWIAKHKEYLNLPKQISKRRSELEKIKDQVSQRRSELEDMERQVCERESELKKKEERLETLENIFKVLSKR